MADQSKKRQLQERKASEVAQNTASGTSADNSERDQPGDRNRKQGSDEQVRAVQGGDGGTSGGGGGKKRKEQR
jgi:hypothetical protein